MCSSCGGEMKERLVQHAYHWEGKFFAFEDVLARVCRRCGERTYDAEVVKAMERAVLEQPEPKCILHVPVWSYQEVVAA